MKTPYIYAYLHSKLREHSEKGIMKIWEYRKLAGEVMRLTRANSMIVLGELEEMNLIKYNRKNETIEIL